MLEAMSCGLPVVSTNNCMIPEVIEHGVNGFMSNNPKELRGYCELLLNDEKLAIEMGLAARKTIVDKFNLNRFVNEWNNVFERAANLTFKGLFV
jgi:glycosyltransferase involved in cell wall biosynthesis